MDKVSVKLSVSQMEDIIIMLLDNPLNKKFINNVHQLFTTINEKSYSNDIDKEIRVDLIRRIIKAINKIDSTNKIDTLAYIDTSGRNEELLNDILNRVVNQELPVSVAEELAETVSRELQYGTVSAYGENIQDLLSDFYAGNYDNFGDFMENFNSSLTDFNKQLIAARDSGNNTREDVSLNDSSLLNFIDGVIREEGAETAKIRTGIKYINDSLDGGWQNGRLYVALGLAKGWKSSFLLNSAIWAKKYNNLKAKDPSKKPVIVYLTMENSTRETMIRLWGYAKGNYDRIENNTPEFVQQVFQNEKIITPNDPDAPEIIIWSRPNRSINTKDLDVMLDDLAKEGKEAVFVIQDYLKRIRSTENHKELRFELGAITDEFVTIAKQRDIPFLTAMQLNRDSFRDLSEGDTLHKQVEAISRLGAHNVGESIDIVQNCDFAFIIGRVEEPVYDGESLVGNDRFLVFKNLISRNNTPKHNIFLHRFKDGYNLRLEEDYELNHSKSVVFDRNAVQKPKFGSTQGSGYKTQSRKF